MSNAPRHLVLVGHYLYGALAIRAVVRSGNARQQPNPAQRQAPGAVRPHDSPTPLQVVP